MDPVLILAGGIVLMGVLVVLGQAATRRSMSHVVDVLARHATRANMDSDHHAQMVLEKVLGDPAFTTRLHAAERVDKAAMWTRLERASSPPTVSEEPALKPAGWDPDGVPTDDIEAARR